MNHSIAVIGMACRYADAHSPQELWENGIAKRQAFRLIPEERLSVKDYAPESAGGDSIYCRNAAVIEDYEFDRVRFRISGEAFRSSDMTHWLALDVAAQALEDAQLGAMQKGLRARAGVYVGNSLTGEFSRANVLRLRWPFVRRVLETTLREYEREAVGLVQRMEEIYKHTFPATTEESLAGSLSNTISGRISNHFDFKGGAYAVDGACASSLLAVATACSALSAGDVDVALAGGVDLSLDPFELAGFSRLGALARDRMRVFDERSSGFWPGEGCGMIALMRHEEALKRNLPIRAILRGWGISSDGSGGITRPEVAGQLLAIKRAYDRAGYGIETVGYFEAHGTGTTIGDATELTALIEALGRSVSRESPAAVSTIKANIGHTKAAAGIAGLIRAVMAVQTQILPPLTNCERPHPFLVECGHTVRILDQAEIWPSNLQLRAGVSAMGFGGINVHVTLESECTTRRSAFTKTEELQIATEQDCELLLFEAEDAAELRAKISRLKLFSKKLSLAELTDLSIACARRIRGTGNLRAALVVSDPEELHNDLKALDDLLADGQTTSLYSAKGVFIGQRASLPQIGFLFPGQGSPVYPNGGLWARRFPNIRSLYASAGLAQNVTVATEVVQPAVCTASLAGLEALRLAGVEACVALGHSLGELTAYYWAGAFDSSDLLNLARARGLAMARLSGPNGAMASIRSSPSHVERLINGDDLAIAAYNSPCQTVISGSTRAVEALLDRAQAAGFTYTRLGVSHAFHSPLVQPAADALRGTLDNMALRPLHRDVISTVCGTLIDPDADLRALLLSQVTSPVRFLDAVTTVASGPSGIDLFIEVGPGHVLSGIATECVNTPIISLDSGGASLRGLLLATGAAFALGASININTLFAGRFSRSIDLDYNRRFLRNPCEPPPSPESGSAGPESFPAGKVRGSDLTDEAAMTWGSESALDVLRGLIARRTDLPLCEVKSGSRFLADLHLNSIAVSQIVLEAAKTIGAATPAAPAEYVGVTLEKAAEALEELQRARTVAGPAPDLDGIATWARMARIEWLESARRPQARKETLGAGSVWDVFSEPGDLLGLALMQEFRNCPGSGVVACVPVTSVDRIYELLLEYTQRALARHPAQIVYVFQDDLKLGAFVRSAWLEHPEVAMTAVHVPPGDDRIPGWVMAEAASLSGLVECSYDTLGIRREPRLELLPPVGAGRSSRLTARDLLLVSGGGKGIAAECALALARDSRCRLVLMGRSNPDSDRELALNLARFAVSNVEFRYKQADVTNIAEVRNSLRAVQEEWGLITAVLHGAGTNLPKRIEQLSVQDIRITLAPKVDGLRNILSSIDAASLTTLITFGSIIARTGMPGEADYALANAAMGQLAEEWQARYPHCRCLNLEWSVWAGTGMGQRLGVIDSLKRQGISPISVDQGIRMLQAALERDDLPVSTIITSRFSNQNTLRVKEAKLPFLRFVDETRLHYPGVELVIEAQLSISNDPYLEDHALEGERIFPAVMGMEAMAQVASALHGSSVLPQFRNVWLKRPIIVTEREPLRIRIAALQRAPGHVSIAIRSAETSFQVDHFLAECVFEGGPLPGRPWIQGRVPGQEVAVNPNADLYSGILFHKGRFRRVGRYCALTADHSIAEIVPVTSGNWFGHHFPQTLCLGDPAARDAVVHSVQACVPQAPLMPVSVERITLNNTWAERPVEARAKEREKENGVYVYDLEVVDTAGQVCERWEGIRYKAVKCADRGRPLLPALLAPFLQRGFEETLGEGRVRIAIANGTGEQSTRTKRAITILGGEHACVVHRPDGRPELVGQPEAPPISISHADNLTFAATSVGTIGCDIESVAARKHEDWRLLLGPEGWKLAEFLAGEMEERVDASATCVWAARESLTKAGSLPGLTPLFSRAGRDGWLSFSAGSMTGACCIASVCGQRDPLAFALALEKSHARI